MEERERKAELERPISARALEVTTTILARWEAEREKTPLDRVVAAVFRSRHDVNSRERRWISDVVYDTVRFLRRQQWLLEHRGLPATPENLARLQAGLLPESSVPLPTSASPQDYLRITLSFPEEMARELETRLGAEALEAAAALNVPAPVTLRVNPLRATKSQVLAALPDATPATFSPWAFHLPRRVNLHDLPGFREGWFEAQEEASQLTALLTDARPGQTIVDVGAGAGGKTLAIAALMRDCGRIVALDSAEARMKELEKRAQRAGVTCAEICPIVADPLGRWQPFGASQRIVEELRGAADVVLVDAPCTGSGVLRRSPDAKWRVWNTEELARVQYNLLAQSAAFVRPEGRLVYVTCAFERWQNEEIVTAFLRSPAGRDFDSEPVALRLAAACLRATDLADQPMPRSRRTRQRFEIVGKIEDAPTADAVQALTPLTEGPFLRTWPHRTNLDAFFAACLRRRGDGVSR